MSVIPESQNKLSSLQTICASLIAEEPWIIAEKKPVVPPPPKQKLKRKSSGTYSFDDLSSDEDSECPRDSSKYECRSDVNLPLAASEAVFDAFHANAEKMRIGVRAGILGMFFNGAQMPLERLNLENSNVSDEDLVALLRAHCGILRTLNLTDCSQLSPKLNSMLPDISLNNLEILNIGSSVHLFAEWSPRNKVNLGRQMGDLPPGSIKIQFFPMEMDSSGVESETQDSAPQTSTETMRDISPCPDSASEESKFKNHITGCCPNLKMFTFHGNSVDETDILIDGNVPEFLIMVLDPLRQLQVLDLSLWEGVEDLRFLRPFTQTLHTLILYNVPDLHNAVNTICELTHLRFLDISQATRETGTYPRPVSTLDKLVRSLGELAALDISSTNLAATPSGDDWPIKDHFVPLCSGIKSDIVGLRALKKPLDFLGLFNCDAASHFQDIPAIKITGDANEDQVLLSLDTYGKRVDLLQAVLNETYQVYRFGQPLHYSRALTLVVDAMYRYGNDGSIQIAGSASLFYIIRNVYRMMSSQTKRRVIIALLAGMEQHLEEQVMVRNCCLSLCQFDIPQELLFDYERAARLMIQVMNGAGTDQMTQRIVIYLLNAMACHVEGQQKIQVGKLGAIECILDLIKRRWENGVCDEVMEVAWSFLWNITDETEVNCHGFLRHGGMDLFYKCYQGFTDKKELVRNMMGLMGNIAETDLKKHLMRSQYIEVFSELLKNEEDGIEISYNSAGVLAHLCSQGTVGWTILNPTREETMEKVIEATRSWKLDQRRYINYRSFGPILRLLPLDDSPASRHWAVWALANLTSVDGAKYCPYVEKEGGLEQLQLISRNMTISEEIRNLASTVLQNFDKWKKNELEVPANQEESDMEAE